MSDWWSRKLAGNNKPQSRPSPQPQSASYPAVPPAPAPQTPSKATHTRSQGLCPGCGSDNYFSMGTNAQARCYDCGWPIVQQSTGMTGEGPAIPSRQVASDGYQPQNIIGRIN